MNDNRIILNKAGKKYLKTIPNLADTEGYKNLPVAEHVRPNADGTYTCPECQYNNLPYHRTCAWCGIMYLKDGEA